MDIKQLKELGKGTSKLSLSSDLEIGIKLHALALQERQAIAMEQIAHAADHKAHALEEMSTFTCQMAESHSIFLERIALAMEKLAGIGAYQCTDAISRITTCSIPRGANDVERPNV